MMARALISRCGFRVLNLALMAGTIAPPLLAHAQTNALASQSAGQPLLAYDVVAIKPHPPDGSAGSAWRTTAFPPQI